MIVYYRDTSIEITSTSIRVGDRTHRLNELSRVWHRRDRRSLATLAGRGWFSLVLLTPPVLGVIGVGVALRLDVAGTTRLAIILAAILVGLAGVPLLDLILGKLDESFDRGTHTHEIWAERDGVEFRLLRTDDALRFGRVYRALQRAVET